MPQIWVAVADGRKALLFENAGSMLKPDLQVISVEEIENPPSRAQGADRAGRLNDGRAGGVRKSAVEAKDFHQLAEDRFAAKFAASLDKASANGAFDRLVIAAPPTTLGALRDAFTPRLKAKIAFETDIDLVNHPVAEIEKRLAAAYDNRRA
jgi:protein required for attachment to host cells